MPHGQSRRAKCDALINIKNNIAVGASPLTDIVSVNVKLNVAVRAAPLANITSVLDIHNNILRLILRSDRRFAVQCVKSLHFKIKL